MRGQSSRWLALTRAVVLAWLAVAVSTGAHVAAHGQAPSLGATSVLLGLVAFGLLPVSLTPYAYLPTFLALTAAQAVVHVGLSVLAAGEVVAPLSPGQLAGHAQHLASAQAALGSPGDGQAIDHSLLPTPTMAGLHLLAAAMLALLLTRAERTITVLVRLSNDIWATLVGAFLAALRRLVPISEWPGRNRTHGRVAAPPRDLWLPRCAAPRGPPLTQH